MLTISSLFTSFSTLVLKSNRNACHVKQHHINIIFHEKHKLYAYFLLLEIYTYILRLLVESEFSDHWSVVVQYQSFFPSESRSIRYNFEYCPWNNNRRRLKHGLIKWQIRTGCTRYEACLRGQRTRWASKAIILVDYGSPITASNNTSFELYKLVQCCT